MTLTGIRPEDQGGMVSSPADGEAVNLLKKEINF